MRGRDPNEPHRAATPLELLFDLTFVIAFGLAASQFAHALAEGHYANGLLGFAFAAFAVCLAWSNFTWFASAYDTDDWIFRVATMAQMIGVLIFALAHAVRDHELRGAREREPDPLLAALARVLGAQVLLPHLHE